MAVHLSRIARKEEHDSKYFKSKSKKLLRLILYYMIFLLIGAAIFNIVEEKAELERCDSSIDAVQDFIVQKTDEYFYLLGINKKICTGIRRAREQEKSITKHLNPVMLGFYYDWELTNCSRRGQEIFQESANEYNNDTAVRQVMGHIMNLSEITHFDDEVFTLSVDVLNKIVKESAEFSVKNYLEIQANCAKKWSFNNAFFFAGTLASTIGYGNLTPSTQFGKIFCLVFILFGIPYFGFLMREMSQLINDLLCALRNEIEDFFLTTLPFVALPSTYVAIGVVFMILLPSWIFAMMEDWSFADSFYFSIISISTIGFGDYVPNMNPPLKYAAKEDIYDADECLSAIIRPMPEDSDDYKVKCQKTKWPHLIEIIFSSYRLAVFFWILLGLVWLSGVVSLVVNGMAQSRQMAARLHHYGQSKIERLNSRRGSLKTSNSSSSLPTLSTALSSIVREPSSTPISSRKPLQLTVSNAL